MVSFATPIRRFLRATQGSISALTALSLTGIMAAAGVAIDMSSISNYRSRLQAAADAAALAVARKAGDEPDAPREQLVRHGEITFSSNLGTLLTNPPIVSIAMTRSGASPESRVTFSAEVPTLFGSFVGKQSISLSGVSTASIPQGGWIDLVFALDVSASMGLGATAAAQNTMQSTIGCVFACHMAHGTSEPTLAVARRLGIPLRLDVAKASTRNLIDRASAEMGTGRVRASVYTYQHIARSVVGLSAFLDDVKRGVVNLELADGVAKPNVAPGESGDTNARTIFDMLNREILDPGQGTKASPQKLVVLFTDGVEGTWTPGLTTRAFDRTYCDTLKSRGVSIAIVEAKYNFVTKDTDGTYPWAVAPIINQAADNLRACASPGLFAVGETPEEIDAAFASIWTAFKSSRLRLTR